MSILDDLKKSAQQVAGNVKKSVIDDPYAAAKQKATSFLDSVYTNAKQSVKDSITTVVKKLPTGESEPIIIRFSPTVTPKNVYSKDANGVWRLTQEGATPTITPTPKTQVLAAETTAPATPKPQRFIKDAKGVWKLTSDPNEVNTADTPTPTTTPSPEQVKPLAIPGIRKDFQSVRTDIQKLIVQVFSDVPHEAVNISAGESSLNPGLVHVNGSNEAINVTSPEQLRQVIADAKAAGRSVDVGLFQINSKWQEANLAKWGYTIEDMLDPVKNIDAARRIYESHGNRWGTTWAANGGQYK